jgi:RNA polymerase-binding protein DksA
VNIEHFRQRLLDLERQLLGRLGREAETVREPTDDRADPADVSRVDELKDQMLAVADSDTAQLAEVRAALRRIDEGSFGRCLADGGPIEEKRLEAVPWAAYCVKHQTENEGALKTPTL